MTRKNVNPNLAPTPATDDPPYTGPIIESPGGVWFRASRWPNDEFKALGWMLIEFGFHGQYKHDRLASLYRAGLHLPVETQRDWDLMEQIVKTFNPTGAKPLPPLDAAHTFIECLRKLNPGKAKAYDA